MRFISDMKEVSHAQILEPDETLHPSMTVVVIEPFVYRKTHQPDKYHPGLIIRFPSTNHKTVALVDDSIAPYDRQDYAGNAAHDLKRDFLAKFSALIDLVILPNIRALSE